MRHGVAFAEFDDVAADGIKFGLIAFAGEDAVDEGGDFFHVGGLEAAGGEGGGADANAAGFKGAAGFVGHGVHVGDDAGGFEPGGGVFAGEVGVGGTQVDEHEVVVGAVAGEFVVFGHEGGGQCRGIGDNVFGVGFEFGLEGFAKGDGFGGDDVHEGPTLGAGEDGGVEPTAEGVFGGEAFTECFVVRKNQSTARPAKGFVGGGGDDVAMGEGAFVYAADDESGDVGDVGPEQGVVAIGDFAEFGEVDGAGVGAVAAHEDFGFVFGADGFDAVVVEVAPVVFAFVGDQVVGDGVEPFARDVDGAAVGEVAAVAEFDGGEGVAGIEQCELNGEVGVGAGVGLDVGVGAAKHFFGAIDGEGFDGVVVLAAGVVALAGVAFGIFVGHDRALGGHDGGAGVVFTGDHFEGVLLPLGFGSDEFGDDGIDGFEGGGVGCGHGGVLWFGVWVWSLGYGVKGFFTRPFLKPFHLVPQPLNPSARSSSKEQAVSVAKGLGGWAGGQVWRWGGKRFVCGGLR